MREPRPCRVSASFLLLLPTLILNLVTNCLHGIAVLCPNYRGCLGGWRLGALRAPASVVFVVCFLLLVLVVLVFVAIVTWRLKHKPYW